MTNVQLNLQCAENLDEPPPRGDFQQWVNIALMQDQPVQVNIRIIDEAESQSLNNEYRNKDKATNILSFPMELPEDVASELEFILLGDLAICLPIVESEAKLQGKPTIAHWAHLVIHGMLHLQGYDHLTQSTAAEMEGMEIKLLQKIAIENPYLEIS